MYRAHRISRRHLLQQLLVGVPLAGVVAGAARAAGEPLLAADSPEAKAVGYVEDAKSAKEAPGGHHCSDCALFRAPRARRRGRASSFPASR